MRTRRHPTDIAEKRNINPSAHGIPDLFGHTSDSTTILKVPTTLVAFDVNSNDVFVSSNGAPVRARARQNSDVTALDQFKIQRLVRRTVKTGQSHKEEFRVRSTNGEMRIVESETGVLFGMDGELAKVVVTTRDITPQKDLQEALLRSERRFRLMIENGADVIAELDLMLLSGGTLEGWLNFAEIR